MQRQQLVSWKTNGREYSQNSATTPEDGIQDQSILEAYSVQAEKVVTTTTTTTTTTSMVIIAQHSAQVLS